MLNETTDHTPTEKPKKNRVWKFDNVRLEIVQEQSYYYVQINSKEQGLVELYLSSILSSSRIAEILHKISDEVKDIQRDPHGERSIDPGKHEEPMRSRRAVNLLSSEIANELGIEVAVKSVRKSVRYKEDLRKQFIFMNELRNRWQESATPEQKSVISVNFPLGCVITGEDELLFMEAIIGAQHCESIELKDLITNGISLSKYPEFLVLIPKTQREKYQRQDEVSWNTISNFFRDILGVKPDDIDGRNILVYSDTETGKRKLCLIDQSKPKDERFQSRLQR